MTKKMSFTNRATAICFCAMLLLAVASVSSADTIVNFQTPLGNFDVQLYDTAAPITVANFLNYVNSGRYEDSFFHRLVPGFVLQGGGYTYDGTFGQVEEFGPIQNEFDSSRSNLRGTLAMAKLGGDPDSATSEFFFNLANNSANLDAQNGGFTVFAEVMGNGMDVVDLLASQQVWNQSTTHPVFSNVPLINYNDTPPWGPYAEYFTITVQEHPAGDFDGDYVVDSVDFDIWNANYPTTSGATLGIGDADGDGDVDGVDFGIWQANCYSNTETAATAATAIPEPATLGLLLTGGLALLRKRSK